MRIDLKTAAKGQYQAMSALERQIAEGALDRKLRHLVKLRASQINGCAFCIDMHVAEARADGERDERLHQLNAWRHSPLFDARERAALGWTEALTRLAGGDADDASYEEVRRHFDEQLTAELTWVIAAINTWNRMCVAFRTDLPKR